jgi:hypothetical protein
MNYPPIAMSFREGKIIIYYGDRIEVVIPSVGLNREPAQFFVFKTEKEKVYEEKI